MTPLTVRRTLYQFGFIFTRRRSVHNSFDNDLSNSFVLIRKTPRNTVPCNAVDDNSRPIQDTSEDVLSETVGDTSETRMNEVNIQMLSKNLYKQLFGEEEHSPDPTVVSKCREHLRQHGIDYMASKPSKDVVFKLPKLKGKNIVEHFQVIAEEQSSKYRILMNSIVSSELPELPKNWLMKPGWHRYHTSSPPEPVPYPPDDALMFDVEVLMSAGSQPTLACAASKYCWYGWVSESLLSEAIQKQCNVMEYDKLIPLESDQDGKCPDRDRARIVIGHNVCYDRVRVKEQYWLERTGLRFMDTMSMHTCISGVTSYQRTVLLSKDKPDDGADDSWMDISSLNSLAEVHKLYCGTPLKKDPREIFVKGSYADVRRSFQQLMAYCAGDVAATHRVLRKLTPLFEERFPHPITLAGMLELGTAYLPVNKNWLRYIESADTTYQDLQLESRHLLSLKADEACRLMHRERYKTDLWMWDQDWSTQELKLKKATKKKMQEIMNDDSFKEETVERTDKTVYEEANGTKLAVLNEDYMRSRSPAVKEISNERLKELSRKFGHLYRLKEFIPKNKPTLAGYPAWYRKLCTKPEKDKDWTPGANNITTSMKVTPKLLRLSWEGYPLHHVKDEGWGFLVPFAAIRPDSYYEETEQPHIPLQELIDKCPVVDFERSANKDQSLKTLEYISKNVDDDAARRSYYARKKLDDTASEHRYTGLGVWSGMTLQSCCHFLKLPHKDGPKYKVGNPLSKDFLDKFSQNVLSAQGDEAEKVLNLGRMMSYWRNNRARILSQQVVFPPDAAGQGAVLPQVVVCGTLTRRAVEPTWMTASNAHAERVGSELRAMVQAPTGYRFVGADVDSQELWIAALLGDSTLGIPGGTAFGWAVLAGNKAQGTDMHSLTARAAGISRDHAKVINYARIYGAGQMFAERLLKQFNPTMTNSEAKSKAAKMFQTTKGRRVYTLKPEFLHNFLEEDVGQTCDMTSWQAQRLAKLSGRKLEDMFERGRWVGGTESLMFNKLEDIADSPQPATAFLSARLSRALEHSEGRWASTRLNWAVQSAAADFLHLMLVSMAWLAPKNTRFCLSFHDEVRYLVPEQHAYEAALALQLTNLFTRAFCSQRVGLRDLPLSVAFFTSVEVDRVLRKESHLDCRTPSNPHGLQRGYGIPDGESLDIHTVLHKTAAR